MDPWVWLAAYLVGFALFQLILYHHFREDATRTGGVTSGGQEHARSRSVGRDSTSSSQEDSAAAHLATAGGPDPAPSDDVVHCTQCGARNERTFTFCWQCANPLQ